MASLVCSISFHFSPCYSAWGKKSPNFQRSKLQYLHAFPILRHPCGPSKISRHWPRWYNNFASLVLIGQFSPATNYRDHWFSMPAGRLSLVTVGRRDQRQMCKIAISPQLLSARSRNARKRCLESFTVCAPRPPIAIAATHPICLLCQCKRRVSAGLIKNTAHTIAFVITVSRSWNWTLIRSMVRTHLFTIMLLHHHQSLGPHSWLAERFCSITRSRNPSSYYPSCLYFLGCI